MDEDEYDELLKQIDAVQRQYEESDIFCDELIEPLSDEDGYIPGCYKVKQAPTYG